MADDWVNNYAVPGVVAGVQASESVPATNSVTPPSTSLPTPQEAAAKALAIAKAWADYGLRSTPGETDTDMGGEIDKIENLWQLHDQPWCAMFACYCWAKAICEDEEPHFDELRGALQVLGEHFFTPSPSCEAMKLDAQREGRWFDVRQARPGDLILYCWDGSGVAQHVGLFSRALGNGLYEAVEGNTTQSGTAMNTHGVYVRTRREGVILGIIAPGSK